MEFKNKKWYLYLINNIDIDNIITTVAESHNWLNDADFDDEYENNNTIFSSPHEWFDSHFQFAENDAIEEIKNISNDILISEFDLEFDENMLYEISTEILSELY